MKKSISKKNILIIVLLVVILMIFLMFMFSKKSDDNNKPINNNPSGNNEIVEKNVYKTKDSRFTLKIVEIDDQEAYSNARLRYGENNFEEIIKPNILLYAYLNNRVFAIDEVVEDDNYALYSLVGLPTEEYGHKVLVNKKNNTIEVSDEVLKNVSMDCLKNGFCGFNIKPRYIKGQSGYYFVNDDNGLITVYTTSWKKIGYVEKISTISLDVDGNIKVYEKVEKSGCVNKYCNYKMSGEEVTYDINGNKK